MGLAQIPNDMKLEIINKLETADKLSVRQVCQSLKDVVDQTKMHYDVLTFDFLPPDMCKVTLFVPGGNNLSLFYKDVKGGHTVTYLKYREQPKTVKKEGCFMEAAVKKFMDVLLKPRNSFGSLEIDPRGWLVTLDRKEKKEKLLKMLYDGLATLKHRIPVEAISIKFDCYQEVTEVIKHLVPGHLKRISGSGFYRDREEAPYVGDEMEDLTPNGQNQLNELAELEQFRQAKGLHINDEFLSLPPEKTAHFTDLTCNEKELKVESLDGIIENFLRPNGWAYRKIYFEEFDAIPFFEWLKKRALREFGRKLEDVVEEGRPQSIIFSWLNQHARTITFRRGFYECSLTFWINWMIRDNGQLYVENHSRRLEFVNQKLMLWNDVRERPDEITEEMVQKERERQEEVKRQDELRQAEEELEEQKKAELEQNQVIEERQQNDGQSNRDPQQPSNSNRRQSRYQPDPRRDQSHQSNQDYRNRQNYGNRQSNRDPRNRNNLNCQQNRYQSNSRDYHQSHQSNQDSRNRQDYGRDYQQNRYRRDGQSSRDPQQTGYQPNSRDYHQSYQSDQQSYMQNQNREQYRNGPPNRGSVSYNQPNRRDNHYGSNQSRDGQYNRNGTCNQHYQSYQDNQWQPRNSSPNRNSSSWDQPRRYQNDYHRGTHYQSGRDHPSHGSSRREQGYQSYQPNQNQSSRRTPDQYSRDQASHGTSSCYQSYQERNHQYSGQSGRYHHDSYQYRHRPDSYQHYPSQNWQPSRELNRYQADRDPPVPSRGPSNQYHSNNDSEYRPQYEAPRQDDRYQNHRDASRQQERSSYAQRR